MGEDRGSLGRGGLIKLGPVLFVLILSLASTQGQTNGTCDEFQFECTDGTCIDDFRKCNGVANCPDGSDETALSCHDFYCPPYAFRCLYGACIRATFECNGQTDCVDNSDELTLRCPGIKEMYSRSGNCSEDQFQCANGECIFEDRVCNGKRDCSDGSEETVAICSNHYCPSYAFRCAYGACVPGNRRCNGVNDCADNSDETPALCGRGPAPPTPPSPSRPADSCPVPVIADGAAVTSSGAPFTKNYVMNGQTITFTCRDSPLNGPTEAWCINGEIIPGVPQCTKGCSTLPLDTLAVGANCENENRDRVPCPPIVPPRTVAQLFCKNGYSPVSGEFTIYCHDDGSWSQRIPRCAPICGEVAVGVPYISGGRVGNITQVPWHVAIYEDLGRSDNQSIITQICGGSIISPTAILSAAHCFWDAELNKAKDASRYYVTAGKTIRDYNAAEVGVQKFQVQEIVVRVGYFHARNLYSGDIAVLRLKSPIIYMSYIRPICINFAAQNAELEVQNGTSGRVAGWGLTEVDQYSPVLKVIDLTVVDYYTCLNQAEETFKPFILPDKFCAGRLNENVCEGDSGGGFTQAVTTGEGKIKYYLRGLVSVGSKIGHECTASRFSAFTNILYHGSFIHNYTQV